MEKRVDEQRLADSGKKEHDAGIRIRGEAPATGRVEHDGMTPGAPPAELDSPPPGSLQGSTLGVGPAMAGVMPVDEGRNEKTGEAALCEGIASCDASLDRAVNSPAAVDSERAESQGLERDLGEEAGARATSDKGRA